jgi:hypothetical protein
LAALPPAPLVDHRKAFRPKQSKPWSFSRE